MSRKNKRGKRRGKNTHHIFAQSRFPQYNNEGWNQVEVPVEVHDLSHWLFKNRTPQEILDFLCRVLWGGHFTGELKWITNVPGSH